MDPTSTPLWRQLFNAYAQKLLTSLVVAAAIKGGVTLTTDQQTGLVTLGMAGIGAIVSVVWTYIHTLNVHVNAKTAVATAASTGKVP